MLYLIHFSTEENHYIFKEYCANSPSTPSGSKRIDSEGVGKDIIGQVLTFTCEKTGHEFKTVDPSTQGIKLIIQHFLNFLLF